MWVTCRGLLSAKNEDMFTLYDLTGLETTFLGPNEPYATRRVIADMFSHVHTVMHILAEHKRCFILCDLLLSVIVLSTFCLV